MSRDLAVQATTAAQESARTIGLQDAPLHCAEPTGLVRCGVRQTTTERIHTPHISPTMPTHLHPLHRGTGACVDLHENVRSVGDRPRLPWDASAPPSTSRPRQGQVEQRGTSRHRRRDSYRDQDKHRSVHQWLWPGIPINPPSELMNTRPTSASLAQVRQHRLGQPAGTEVVHVEEALGLIDRNSSSPRSPPKGSSSSTTRSP